VPFSLLVAVSRVILGLRYPSDVAAGGTIGVAVAGASFLVRKKIRQQAGFGPARATGLPTQVGRRL
jgi:membrane-associated phospholipid phosphatase